jgi:hypothetical protein
MNAAVNAKAESPFLALGEPWSEYATDTARPNMIIHHTVKEP